MAILICPIISAPFSAMRRSRRCLIGGLSAVLLDLLSHGAIACGPRLIVEFYESSDGDLFGVSNKSEAPWSVKTLTLILSGSRGRLIFDTASGGLGASMPAPLYVVSSDVGFAGASQVDDGGEVVALTFSAFLPGQLFLFSIDVDDRLADSGYGQADVSDGEMEGASVHAEMVHANGRITRIKGVFDSHAVARLGGGELCA